MPRQGVSDAQTGPGALGRLAILDVLYWPCCTHASWQRSSKNPARAAQSNGWIWPECQCQGLGFVMGRCTVGIRERRLACEGGRYDGKEGIVGIGVWASLPNARWLWPRTEQTPWILPCCGQDVLTVKLNFHFLTAARRDWFSPLLPAKWISQRRLTWKIVSCFRSEGRFLVGNEDWIFISTSSVTTTSTMQVGDQGPRWEGGEKDSPRLTSSSRHSPHHAGSGFLNSPTADVARPDKISGADINSICQEVGAGLSASGMGCIYKDSSSLRLQLRSFFACLGCGPSSLFLCHQWGAQE